MAKFRTRQFERDISKALASKPMQQKAFQIAEQQVSNAQHEMVQEFESHPVTKEIDGGANSSNVSGTLGGYGNLFSFIGFSAGSRPTEDIRQYISQNVMVNRQPRVSRKQAAVDMTFKIKVPTLDGVEAVSPSPWSGKSWSREIERGISGFGFYMTSDEGFSDSRSGKAVQLSNKIRAMAYRPIKYMSSILNKFYSKIG